MNTLRRLLTPPLIVVAAILTWYEEWLWEHLKRLMSIVARFPIIRWYEAAILRLPPYPMLVVFLLPLALLLPLKLLAVYWLAKGYWLASVLLYTGEKVVGTAIVARSFVICHPKLMTIGWFKHLHDWLIATRDYLYAAIREIRLFQIIHAWIVAMKQELRRWLSVFRRHSRRGLWSRWRAIRRWHSIRRATKTR